MEEAGQSGEGGTGTAASSSDTRCDDGASGAGEQRQRTSGRKRMPNQLLRDFSEAEKPVHGRAQKKAKKKR